MPFSPVGAIQQGTDSDAPGVDGVITLTLTGVGVANGIIVGISMLSTTITVSSVACSGEANLVDTKAIDRITSGSGCTGSKQFFYLDETTSSGTKTITITLSAGNSAIEAWAIAVDGPIEFVAGSDVIATGSSAAQSVSLGSLPANSIIIASAISGYANGDLTADAAFTGITLSNWDGNFGGEYDLDSGAAGTKTADMTTAGSGPWAIKAAAFSAPSAPAPEVDQNAFRFREDDGSESAATGAAGQDTNITRALATPVRLRARVQTSGDVAASAFTLEYRRQGDALFRRLKKESDL